MAIRLKDKGYSNVEIGRKMGRKQAQRELNLESEIDEMNKKGILHNMKTIEDLDESASAYKDIDVVMDNQKDLVKILVELDLVKICQPEGMMKL
jgi:RNA-splicing ligase RtcB